MKKGGMAKSPFPQVMESGDSDSSIGAVIIHCHRRKGGAGLKDDWKGKGAVTSGKIAGAEISPRRNLSHLLSQLGLLMSSPAMKKTEERKSPEASFLLL